MLLDFLILPWSQGVTLCLGITSVLVDDFVWVTNHLLYSQKYKFFVTYFLDCILSLYLLFFMQLWNVDAVVALVILWLFAFVMDILNIGRSDGAKGNMVWNEGLILVIRWKLSTVFFASVTCWWSFFFRCRLNFLFWRISLYWSIRIIEIRLKIRHQFFQMVEYHVVF